MNRQKVLAFRLSDDEIAETIRNAYDFPEGGKVMRVWCDYGCNTFVAVIQHESFEEILPGTIVPYANRNEAEAGFRNA